MKTVCIVQARLASTRLPAKVLLPLNGHTVLEEVLRRCKRIPGVHKVVAAIPDAPDCDVLLPFIERQHVAVTRGSEIDVLSRYALAAQEHDADIIMRITSDCPVLNPNMCGAVLSLRERDNSDYASNIWPARSFAQGLDCEVFTRDCLDDANVKAVDPYDREHVTPYIQRHAYDRCSLLKAMDDTSHVRLTLDTLADYLTILKAFDEAHSDIRAA